MKGVRKPANKNIKKGIRSPFRRDFYKRLLYIALCVIPIIIFAREEGKLRLVPVPFFIIGMYHLIMIIQLSQHIIDDFFPPKTRFEAKVNPFNNFIYYFSSALFFVGLVCQIFEIRHLDNTIHGTKLFWAGGAIGVVLAIIATILLKATNPSVYFESKRRYTVHFGLFVGFFLLTSALAGFINHYFADKAVTCTSYIVLQKGIGGNRSKEYFLHLEIAGSKERFSVGKRLYDAFAKGEDIELCTVKGMLGFDYVTEFKKIDN